MDYAGILSKKNILAGGGPFGALITQGNQIIAAGTNRVTSNNDPTAHAEVVTIRRAAENINNYDLNGLEIYSSAEPCPMCLGAIQWARLKKIHFANTVKQTSEIDFDDEAFYKGLEIPTKHIPNKMAIEAFKYWKETDKKTHY